MKLSIITTQKTLEYSVDWLEINTPVGNMVIQAGHVPMMIELSAGCECLFQITDGSRVESIMIVQGVAHITRLEVTLLLPIDL